MKASIKYKEKMASILGCYSENLFLFWKGRVALYSALKAIGVKTGDEVILQAFTCVVVPNAVIYTGATPIYVDVQIDTFNMSLNDLISKLTSRTKAVIIQNTFGLSSEVEVIVDYCKSKGIVCIEDCTHGFGGTYNGKSNGSLADFAFYSTQWNKPFSTGVGGILRINNSSFLEKIRTIHGEAINPNTKESTILSILILARRFLLNDTTYWVLINLYRKLTAWNLVVGSSSPEEIEAPKLPLGFLKQGDKVQCVTGIKALRNFSNVLSLRKRNAKAIEEFLVSNSKKFVNKELSANHSFLIYPILVKDRGTFMRSAENKGIPLGDWFISPIHPVEQNFHLWQLEVDNFPNAKYLSDHILNIPLDKKSMKNYLLFLNENIDQII